MNRLYWLILYVFLLSSELIAQQSSSPNTIHSLAKADSLFLLQKWNSALPHYESALKQDQHKKNALAWNRLGLIYHNLGMHDKAIKSYQESIAAGPSAALKPFVYSRLARAYGVKGEDGLALEELKHAVGSGYSNQSELDTAREFSSIRHLAEFRQIVQKAISNAFPCKEDTLKRAFDFWVGEWDVFATGTNSRVGHSLVQKASGDCMILENWTAAGPVPQNGKSMNYVNTQTNKWEQLWVGSGGGPNYVTRFYDGEYRDSTMQFRFESTSPQGKLMGKFRFFNQGPNQVRQLSETSGDGGKTWIINYDFTYRRKK